MCRQLRSNSTSHCGQGRRAVAHPLLDRRRRPRGRWPWPRSARRRAVVDRVDHADVAERRHDHLGHPAQGLGERQRAVGDRADRVEQPQALGAARRSRAERGAGDRQTCPAAITIRRTTCSDSPCHVPGGLAAAAPTPSTATPAVATGPATIAATNGAATKVPTIAADSLVRAMSAATQTASVSSPAAARGGHRSAPAGGGRHSRSLLMPRIALFAACPGERFAGANQSTA